jgi:Uma2 family endonuclease
MTTQLQTAAKTPIEYPDDDGLPMADNTLQYETIVTIKGNLDAQYRHDKNVFVGGNLLWYPVEGHPTIRQAPDVLVAFGRPKIYRGSYKQWLEDGIAPQVVFEILSPGNRPEEMDRAFEFYDRYGVDEYYIYDPDEVEMMGWQRMAGILETIMPMHNHVSKLLGIRFDLTRNELVIFGPGGKPFRSFVEIVEHQEKAENQFARERKRAEREKIRAEQEKIRADRLAAQLKALGVDPDE